MIRRVCATCLLTATLAGCGSRDNQQAANTLTPAPPPPSAPPDAPKHVVNKNQAKPRPPAPPRLNAPK